MYCWDDMNAMAMRVCLKQSLLEGVNLDWRPQTMRALSTLGRWPLLLQSNIRYQMLASFLGAFQVHGLLKNAAS